MQIEPDLSICIVAGAKPKTLRRLLHSIEETSDPVSVEIVVAETEPGGTAGLADSTPGMLVIYTHGLNRIAALNQTIRHTRGRYLALLDPDMIIQPECLKRLIDFMDDTPDTGLAAPKIVNLYGMAEPSVNKFPGVTATILGSSCFKQGVTPAKTSEIDWSMGGFHLIRRECLDEIGLLDETLPACAELALYRQAQKKGWHSVYVTEAITVHTNPARHQSPLRPSLGERIRCLKKRWLP